MEMQPELLPKDLWFGIVLIFKLCSASGRSCVPEIEISLTQQ